jgi:hypothetical protein
MPRLSLLAADVLLARHSRASRVTARRRDGFPGVFLPRVQRDGGAVVDPRAVISYSPKPAAKNDSRKHPYELRRDVPQSRL